MRLAVFASGTGSNLEAISKKVTVDLVFSDNPDARALTILPNTPRVTFAPRDFASRIEYEEALAQMIRKHDIDLVALAGYMRVVGTPLLNALPGMIVNLHPSLLPAFKGKNAIERAFESRVPETGVTVHVIDEGLDTGPILAQETVVMRQTLAELEAAIHETEHRLYPQVIERILKGEE